MVKKCFRIFYFNMPFHFKCIFQSFIFLLLSLVTMRSVQRIYLEMNDFYLENYLDYGETVD